MARAAPTAAGHKNARPTTTSPKKRHATTSTPWDSPANLDKPYMMTTRQVGGYADAAAAVPPSDGCAAAAVDTVNRTQTSRRLRRRSGGCAAERRLRRRRDGQLRHHLLRQARARQAPQSLSHPAPCPSRYEIANKYRYAGKRARSVFAPHGSGDARWSEVEGCRQQSGRKPDAACRVPVDYGCGLTAAMVPSVRKPSGKLPFRKRARRPAQRLPVERVPEMAIPQGIRLMSQTWNSSALGGHKTAGSTGRL